MDRLQNRTMDQSLKFRQKLGCNIFAEANLDFLYGHKYIFLNFLSKPVFAGKKESLAVKSTSQ
jgi:hypothetical protein